MSVNHSIRRKGVNRFLSDLYGRERLLSQILKEQGLSEEKLRVVQSGADCFVTGVIQVWRDWWAEILDERRCTVLVRRYGLDGQQPTTLQELGSRFSLSRERIRQLHRSALHRLSTAKRKSTLDRLAVEQAQKYTGQ